MSLQENFIKLIVNPVVYLLWHAVYALAVLFLFVAKIGLAIKELSLISVEPKTSGELTVRHGLIETSVP